MWRQFRLPTPAAGLLSRVQETVDLMARRDLRWCRWRFLRTARCGVLAAGGGLDHESCEKSRKTRKPACWQGPFSCISCASVTFVFQTLSLKPQMSLPFSVRASSIVSAAAPRSRSFSRGQLCSGRSLMVFMLPRWQLPHTTCPDCANAIRLSVAASQVCRKLCRKFVASLCVLNQLID